MTESALLPKPSTIEAVVLNKLITTEGGITWVDFEDKYEMTDAKLKKIVTNLRNGMFESEEDSTLRFDS